MRKLISTLAFACLFSSSLSYSQVLLENNQLVLDGRPQPQLFGAELQYFRLRGGYGKNVPREKVIALWDQALQRMVEAKMNTVSFYIPWDFHEYAEGKFDFTGTADEDHDGRPDYPSRDLKTFFSLIEKHGIKRIMARPGPYINAEWGFLGFGAIPEWFHDKYPDSHMQTSWGWSTRLYDYHNPDLLRHTQLWFQAVYDDVLKEHIGPGKPVVFLQLDNETNYQWQSIYNHDYGPRSVKRYQEFLQEKYQTLSAVNTAHGRSWTEWSAIRPPVTPRLNLKEDQDWYRFSDTSLTSYLSIVRKLWENIGVREPQVLFTLAESFNSVENGLLPNYEGRNLKGQTGMMTVNLYPKTDEYGHPFLNQPFKADLDVKAAESASDTYVGAKQEWLLGPEIQGGWWRGTRVEPAARLQTYLTVLGHGMKAVYVYYFNEGQNWDVDWGYKKTMPLLQQLQKEWNVETVPLDQLTNEFWGELQARADRTVVVGIDVRRILQRDPFENKDLYFDAPLDGDAKPREHFYQLKAIGERLIEPYQDFLARAIAVEDAVAIVRDNDMHAPTGVPALLATTVTSDWMGGLLGYLLNNDVNPRILHGDLPSFDSHQSKMLFHIDTGVNAAKTLQLLRRASERGQTLVNFLSTVVAREVGFPIVALPTWNLRSGPSTTAESLVFYVNSAGELSSGREPDAKEVRLANTDTLYTYANIENCEPVLFWRGQPAGLRCQNGGKSLFQFGVHFFKDFNSGVYGQVPSALEKSQFMNALLKEAKVTAKFDVVLENGNSPEATAIFARQDPLKKTLWITLKTGSSFQQRLRVKLSESVLAEAFGQAPTGFSVMEPLQQSHAQQNRWQLQHEGVPVTLSPRGSTVLVIEVAP